MKKYVKPMITLERFELSQNIAACAWDMNQQVGSCTAEADKSIFGDSMSGFLFSTAQSCTYKADNQESYCYQNGSGSLYGIFMS